MRPVSKFSRAYRGSLSSAIFCRSALDCACHDPKRPWSWGQSAGRHAHCKISRRGSQVHSQKGGLLSDISSFSSTTCCTLCRCNSKSAYMHALAEQLYPISNVYCVSASCAVGSTNTNASFISLTGCRGISSQLPAGRSFRRSFRRSDPFPWTVD